MRPIPRGYPRSLLLPLVVLVGVGIVAEPASGQGDTLVVANDTITQASDSVRPGPEASSDPGTADPAPDSTSEEGLSEADRENPFAGFETHVLSNGVKVWYKRLRGAPNVSVSVGIPYGFGDDPEGLEEIAHFTEHMLFSDHRGLSEEEIKEQIESLGGRRNGITAPDHTWYYVTIGREHGLFALEWLGRIVEPHAMDPEVVDRNREPIALEIGAQPREIAERVSAVLNPSWLRLPAFWEREFGYATRVDRRWDRWATLQAITADDLRNFYENHYVPDRMTVTIVGDLEREAALEQAQLSFGGLLPRSAGARIRSVEDPGRSRATFAWAFRPNIRYERRFKVFEPDAVARLHLQFTADFLGRRLNRLLRYGERKAIYGISVTTLTRGPTAMLQIQGRIDPDEYDFAVGVIEEELDALRTATFDPAEFDQDRKALVERLRNANQTADALNQWTFREYYDPDVFLDFPDVIGFYRSVTRDDLAEHARTLLAADRELLRVVRPLPYDQALIVAAALLLVWLTYRGMSLVLTRSIKMTDLRYMARFRVPAPLAVLRATGFLVAAVVLGRLIAHGFTTIDFYWVRTVDAFWTQTGAYAGMTVASIVLALLYLSRIPRKILVFPDHIRIKSVSFRSRMLVPEDVTEITLKRMPSVWFGKRLLGTTALTFGLLKPGIFLGAPGGRSYFFRTRNTDEMLAVLTAWWGGAGAEPAEPKAETPPPPEPPDETPPPPPQDDLDIDSLDIDDPELEALLRANP